MAKRNYRPRIPVRAFNMTIQDFHVKRRFPDFTSYTQGGRAVWKGSLHPRLTSPKYLIEVRYNSKTVPKVWVMCPPLVKGVPHLYSEGNLCLYWPPEWRWRPDQLIAETIIPWSASWLFYYELWLDTGKWLGPSSHEPIE